MSHTNSNDRQYPHRRIVRWSGVCSISILGACASSDGTNATLSLLGPNAADASSADERSAPPPQTVDGGSRGGGLPAPDTAVGRQLAWFVEVLNRGGIIAEAELRQHLTERNLTSITALQSGFRLMGGDTSPVTIVEIGAGASETALQAVLVGPQAQIAVSMALEAATGLIDSLLPSVEPDYTTGRPTSWKAVESSLARLAPRASFLVARADGSECEPLHGLAVEERLAITSASNLYVLAELARQIAAGIVGWDDTVVVRDALKSSYPGELPNLPDGTLLSVLEVATKMLSLSDQSATDHLIDLLGRENVEANLSAAGHGAPELNTPFLTTREVAQLRLAPGAEADAYLAGDLQGKRALLAGLVGQTPNFVDPWMLPQRHNDQIEWFASAAELCQVMLSLDTRADQPGLSELRGMLAINPGLGQIDKTAFPYVAYQGMAEAGVRHMNWLVRSAEGDRYFVSIGVNDPDVWIPMYPYIMTALAIFDLLEVEP